VDGTWPVGPAAKKNQLLIAQANLISVIDNLQAYDDLQP
jgi:hypothetical protein